MAHTRIFQHPSKVRVEIMANRCLHTLLAAFMPLALVGDDRHALEQFEQLRLLSILNAHLGNFSRRLGKDVYQNILCVLDMITAMNDHEAYQLAKELQGGGAIQNPYGLTP